MGYYLSAAFYQRGVEAACGVRAAYTFLVIEQDPPHLCSLVGMSPEHFEVGAARIAQALRTWQACVASNRWPAYPARVCYPELSPWEAVRAEEEAESPTFERMVELGGQA